MSLYINDEEEGEDRELMVYKVEDVHDRDHQRAVANRQETTCRFNKTPQVFDRAV